MFSYNFKVSYSASDANGAATTLALMNYLQDTSTFESDSLGFDVVALPQDAPQWILGGWHIELSARPHFNDCISVKTAAHHIKRTRISRYFSIYDDKNNCLLKADSTWFVYDPIKARIIKLPPETNKFVDEQDALDVSGPPKSIDIPDTEIHLTSQRLIRHSHLDANRHVNNAQYVQLALDALEECGYTWNCGSLDILYHKMAFLHDTIQPRVVIDKDQKSAVVTLTDVSSNDTLVLARFGGISHE